MKYVVLIHSNPQPWGHPTIDYTELGREIPDATREQMNADFDQLLEQLQASGELLGGQALADPASASIYRWREDSYVVSDGPYAESKEYFAGFFLLDCATRERAEAIAAQFASPGDVIELRPLHVF